LHGTRGRRKRTAVKRTIIDRPIGLARWPNYHNKPCLGSDARVYDGVPRFDKGRFAASRGMADARPGSGFKRPIQSTLSRQVAGPKGPSGTSLPGTWEGGNKANPNPTVFSKIGKDKSYETLVRASERNIDFTKPYPLRWNGARKSFDDLRRHGKASGKLDVTYEQEAYRAREVALCRPSKKPEVISLLPWLEHCPLSLWLDRRFLFLLLGWLHWASPATKPAQCRRDRRYWVILDTSPGEFINFGEMVTAEARQRSREHNRLRKSQQATRFLTPQEELDLFNRYKAGDITGQRIVIAHMPLVNKAARGEDERQEGYIALIKALDTFDPALGRFATYAKDAIESALADYYRKQKRHRALSLDAKIHDDGEPDDRTWLDYLFDAPTYEAALPSLDCLSPRERIIIEKRYLNSGRQPLERHVIGAELGISDERVRQIEARAVAKLKKIGHPRSPD
jgi:RNA polymerase sigma factor (sigma-70 family)